MAEEREMGDPKRIIFSLGFDTSGVISVLTELPLRSGDEIVFLVPSKETPKSREARQSIERFIGLLAQRGLDLKHRFISLDEEDAPGMVAEIVGLIDESPGPVYLEALGGLRSIVASMVVAALLRGDRIAELAAVAESTSKRVAVPLPPLKPPRFTQLQLEILRIALSSKNGKISLPQLAIELGKPKTTLSDNLHKLEKWGLLKQVGKRPATYTPTPLARVFTPREG